MVLSCSAVSKSGLTFTEFGILQDHEYIAPEQLWNQGFLHPSPNDHMPQRHYEIVFWFSQLPMSVAEAGNRHHSPLCDWVGYGFIWTRPANSWFSILPYASFQLQRKSWHTLGNLLNKHTPTALSKASSVHLCWQGTCGSNKANPSPWTQGYTKTVSHWPPMIQLVRKVLLWVGYCHLTP